MPGLAVTLEPHASHLAVAQRGRLADMAEARELQRQVERACKTHGLRRVLFDNRDTEAPDDEIREAMFAWAAAGFDRVALLLRSDLKAVRANMDAVSRRAHVRGFVDEAEALAWLAGRALPER